MITKSSVPRKRQRGHEVLAIGNGLGLLSLLAVALSGCDGGAGSVATDAGTGGASDADKTDSGGRGGNAGGSTGGGNAGQGSQGGVTVASSNLGSGGSAGSSSSGAGATASTGGASSAGGLPTSGGALAMAGSSGTAGKTGTGGASGNGGSAIGGTQTGGVTSASGTTGVSSTHMYTQGSDLYAYCGEKVLLRGMNQMSIWVDPSGSSYPAMASFGSNTVRIVFAQTSNASSLDTLLTKAEANKMIPMPELHDATGKFDGVPATVNWWAQSSVVEVIKKHEKWTLLNIANEAGDNNVSDSTFQSTYTSAITTLRNAGIKVPLVIDGSGWGQKVEQLLKVGPALLAADPQKNIIFSWHEYTGGSQENSRITTSYEKSKSLGIVLINGEFASAGVGGGCVASIPYSWLLKEAQRVGIGWLAWSWDTSNSDCKSGGSSVFDMTSSLTSASGLKQGWASDVVLNDPNSIKNTSVRPCEWK